MKLNIKQAFSTLLNGTSKSFFSTFFFGGKTIDSGAYNRDEVVNAYKNGIEVRTVIEKYTSGFASIPIKLVDKKGDAVTENYRLDLIDNPNALQTQSQFETEWALQYAMYDECFIHGGAMGVGLSKGRPEFLKMIQGQYVSFELDDNGNIKKYANSFNQTTTLELDAVKPTIGSVLDPSVTQHATSKLITASKVVKKLEQAHDNEINSFANSGIGALVSAKSEDSFTKAQHDNMIERFNDPSKANGLEMTSAAVDVHDIKRTPTDLGVLESSKQGQKALSLVYNIPLPLISEDASTYDNVQAAEKSYALNVLIPDKQLYCDKLNEFLNCKKDGVKFVVDIDKVRQIQKNPKEVQETLSLAKASVNERREAAGLARLENTLYDEPVLAINDQLGYAADIDLSVE